MTKNDFQWTFAPLITFNLCVSAYTTRRYTDGVWPFNLLPYGLPYVSWLVFTSYVSGFQRFVLFAIIFFLQTKCIFHVKLWWYDKAHFPVLNNRWKAPAVAEPVHEPVWDAPPAWRLQGWAQDRKHRTASHCHWSAGGLLKIEYFVSCNGGQYDIW